LRYLVDDCTTASMPNSKGRCTMGEQNVLSAIATPADAVGGVGQRAQIADPQQRVGGGLDPHDGGCQVDDARDGVGRGEVRQLQGEGSLPGERVQQPPGAAVGVVGGHHHVTGTSQRRQRGRDRPHAGRGDHRPGRPLQFGQRRRQHGTRRVPGTGVVELARLAQSAEAVVRRQVDRRDDGPLGDVGVDPGADRCR
jgi:hypothetical protein